MEIPTLGVLLGSGISDLEGVFELEQEIREETSFGYPSDSLSVGQFCGVRAVLLPRHGRGHPLDASHVPYRANLWALRQAGVRHLVSVSAFGSLQEHLKPGDFVIPDQAVDWTRRRSTSYFGDGVAAHVRFADPFCKGFSTALAGAACAVEGATAHKKGALITMEGPQFSTRAEARIYRQWGLDVIGMTSAVEAKLARELEMCYAVLGMVTDYDCWREGSEDVSVKTVLRIMGENAHKARQALVNLARMMSQASSQDLDCACHTALKGAIQTKPNLIPSEDVDEAQPHRTLWGRYRSMRRSRALVLDSHLPPFVDRD